VGCAKLTRMEEITFWQAHGYAWFILPALIFLARIVDVTIATLRMMFVSRGARRQAAIAGFFESLLWIIIVSQIMQNLHNVMCFVAYAAGYSGGTLVGMKIEERLAIGKVMVRVITAKPADALVACLREQRFGVTSVAAEGAQGPVRVIFMALKRSDVPHVVRLVQTHNPNAFYTIEDIRRVSEGTFPLHGDLVPAVRIPFWRRSSPAQ
jgi:uncharacterized protein YebE (UPF0316 family)